MQSILRRRSGVANPLFGLSPNTRTSPSPRTSPAKSPRIRVKEQISTKKNAGTEGKLGKVLGKTANNMFILEIEGKTYNFFRKDLDIADEPKSIKSPKRLSPGSSTAEQIADSFLSKLEPGIADKVISAICKRRTSKKKSPRTTPKRTSPKGRRSVKTCKDDEEISVKTGRCIKRCNADQVRDPDSNRCKKVGSKTRKPSPTVKKPSPRVPSPPKSFVSDDDLIVETGPGEVVEERVRLRSPPRPNPKYTRVEEEEPVTQFITEEISESPFVDYNRDQQIRSDISDDDLLIE